MRIAMDCARLGRERSAAPLSGATALEPQRRRRFLAVCNVRAGLGGQRLVPDVIRALELNGATVEVVETREPGALAACVDCAGTIDAAIAAGGDGTVRALAGVVSVRGIPLGIIPAGTGNVMAADIGMPKSVDKIAEVLMDGPIARVEGGLANGARFYLMCGAGFDAEVIARVRPGLKRRIGKGAYLPAILAVLLRPIESFPIVIDDQRHDASWLVVTHAGRYAGNFLIAAENSVLLPGYSAVLFKSVTRFGRMRELLAIGLGQVNLASSIEVIPAHSIRIEAEVPIQIDGDFLWTGPLSCSTAANVLDLIVPANSNVRGSGFPAPWATFL